MTAGLDVHALQGLRATRRDLDLIRRRIRRHLDEHEGYVAFSGGKDSLVVLDLVRQVAPDAVVMFFDSGLEFPETYAYLEQLTALWSLNLHVIPARMTTLEVLAGNGGWDHRALDLGVPNLHQVLIVEPAAIGHRAHGPGELWGVRAQESRGRAAGYVNALRSATCRCTTTCTTQQRRAQHGGLISRVDGTVAYGPVWDWHTDEIWGHISRNQLPVNPVYDKLRRLGAPEHFLRVSAMIDGSRLEEGRITWLRRGWPTLFEELATVLPRLREFV
ncbi:phosphoadenosine phosphosulfate reductase family protein [Nostocoides sp. F2B08]|uniref:phosphoadenosine phosphosulfate reductase domain-containing protein n=1 Tax=Nostocoides sp. F2B08 TaxID=2653936 RepID=UPI0012632370|nr:phosphoadenosine phosphosulfate reductase family protein [Tetrasphaera sp. F2B08]KAB7740955.1 phosphoadenosine phosphosulfate reductase family protein [Tetrasphaera sp. F2B08]